MTVDHDTADRMKRCIDELESKGRLRRVRHRSEWTERRSESLVEESLDVTPDSDTRRAAPPTAHDPLNETAEPEQPYEEPAAESRAPPPRPVPAAHRRPPKLKPSKPLKPPTLTDALNLALFTLPPSTLLNENKAAALSDATRALSDVATEHFRKLSDPVTPSEDERVPCCRRPSDDYDHYLKCCRKQIGIALARFSRDTHLHCPYAECDGGPWDRDHRDNWAAQHVSLTCQVLVDGAPCGVHFTQLGPRHLETEHGIVFSDSSAYVEWCEGCRRWVVGEGLRREHEEGCKQR